MPKVSWLPKPKPNYLAALFREYKKQSGKTSEDIAAAIGCSPEAVRCNMNKPAAEWRIGHLLKYCDALGIPYEDALAAAAK